MTQIPTIAPRSLLLVGGSDGRTLIPAETPLRRLNYFDGKFLRAEDLRQEQEYLRTLVAHSNRAGGSGVVHGFDVSLRDGGILLEPGLAIDPEGRVLLLGAEARVALHELLGDARRSYAEPSPKSKPGFTECDLIAQEATVGPVEGTRLHLVTIAHAEALCGEEAVYGRLCEEACATDTARPYRLEGVTLRLRPLTLATPLKTSGIIELLTRPHLRSLVASAYFADEADSVASHISGSGLRGAGWCQGAQAPGGIDVPLGVLAERGGSPLFLDVWTARRERIDPPPRRYWAGRMAMRPWDVFLAHVLQFQCQLSSILRGESREVEEADPCGSERDVMREAADSIRQLKIRLGQIEQEQGTMGGRAILVQNEAAQISREIERIFGIDEKLRDVLERRPLVRSRRVLIEGGIVELPSAGYLPIAPTAAEPLESQVRRLLGEGVDLRFCATTVDYIPHALEEAQHMRRIDLLHGLERRDERPKVDILVPDGTVEARSRPPTLSGYRTLLGGLAEPLLVPADRFLPEPIGRAPKEVVPPKQALGEAARSGGGASRAQEDTMKAGNAFLGSLVSGDLAADAAAVLNIIRGATRPVGAARGERSGKDGGAFHFAMSEGARRVGNLDTMIRVVEELARQEKDSTKTAESLADRFVRVAGERLRTEAPDAFSTGKAAHGRRGSGAGAERAADTPPMKELPDFELPITDLDPVEGASGGVLWGTASAARDPFAVPVGQPTALELRVVGGRGDPEGGAIEIRLTGRYTVTGAVTTIGNRRRVPLGLALRMNLEWTQPDGTTFCMGRSFERDAVVERLDDTLDTAVRIALPLQQGMAIHLLAHWPATAFAADVQLLAGLGTPQGTMYYGRMALRRSTAIFDSADRYHQAAAGAIDTLGEILVEPGFAERARRDLFNPGPAADEGRRIRTARDWVLFRRRRELDCGETTPPAPPPQPEPQPEPEPEPQPEPEPSPKYMNYLVYHAHLPRSRAREIDARFLADPEHIRSLQPQPVSALQYGAEAANIAWGAGPFADAYDQLSPGSDLLAAAIGDVEPFQGQTDELRMQRIQSVLATVADSSTPIDGATIEVVPELPEILPAGENQGVILLITAAPSRVYVHEIVYLPDHDTELITRIRREGVADLDRDDFSRLRIERIAFLDAKPEPRKALAEIVDAWKNADRSPLTTGYVVAPQAELQSRTIEAQVVADALSADGNVGVNGIPQPPGVSLPAGADAVLILV